MKEVNTQIDTIFEACSFQDLTGQRIRRAIEHLQHVESVLAGIGDPDAEIVEGPKPTIESSTGDIDQDEIDRLLADF